MTEDEDTINLRNVWKYSPKDTASHLRGFESAGEIILWVRVRCLTYFQFVVYREMGVTVCYAPCTFCTNATCHGHSVPLLCATDILYHCYVPWTYVPLL